MSTACYTLNASLDDVGGDTSYLRGISALLYAPAAYLSLLDAYNLLKIGMELLLSTAHSQELVVCYVEPGSVLLVATRVRIMVMTWQSISVKIVC